MTIFNVQTNLIASNSIYGKGFGDIQATDTTPFGDYVKTKVAIVIRIAVAPIKSLYRFVISLRHKIPFGAWKQEEIPGGVWKKEDAPGGVWTREDDGTGSWRKE